MLNLGLGIPDLHLNLYLSLDEVHIYVVQITMVVYLMISLLMWPIMWVKVRNRTPLSRAIHGLFDQSSKGANKPFTRPQMTPLVYSLIISAIQWFENDSR